MPKRTNDFQTLIALIEEQLAQEGVRVERSKLFKDRMTGDEREVDVAIEAEVSGHPVVLGVECRDHKRKAAVSWIDELIGKFKNLPVHKVIAVSRSGFTRGALDKAKKNNIDTYTLEEGIEEDWKEVINFFKSSFIIFFSPPKIREVKIVFSDTITDDMKRADFRGAILHDPAGDRQGTISEVVERFLSEKEVKKDILMRAYPDAGTLFKLEYFLEPGSYFVDSLGTRHGVHSLVITAHCSKWVSPIKFEHKSYKGVQVAAGSLDWYEHRFNFAFVEKSDKEARLTWDVRKIKAAKK